ncbi:sperm-associated antigen 1 [Diretmus argenteus]
MQNPVATAASLPKDEWSQIVDELKNSVPERKKNPSKSALPRDYREWDKFDVDKECERIDGNVDREDPPDIIDYGHPKIKPTVNASSLTQQEKLLLANREKVKGNEAFRAEDYEEAVAYYSRSLSIIPTAAAYNNRAQAEIKLKHWNKAMKDCQTVLELEPDNMKALLRRATVHKHMGNLQMADDDLRAVLRQEPQNATATKLLVEIDKKIRECQPEKQGKGKKILIQEVEEEDGDNSHQTTDGMDAEQNGESL